MAIFNVELTWQYYNKIFETRKDLPIEKQKSYSRRILREFRGTSEKSNQREIEVRFPPFILLKLQ